MFQLTILTVFILKDVATPTDGQAATSTYVDKVEILPAQTDTGAVDSTQDDVTAENVFLEEFQLVAPSVLFKKREYPPLHIFVSILLHWSSFP